jgi:hypothetical protein
MADKDSDQEFAHDASLGCLPCDERLDAAGRTFFYDFF